MWMNNPLLTAKPIDVVTATLLRMKLSKEEYNE